MTTELYIPPGSRTLDKLTERPQIRLGIQGYGGTGKTWAALTFPNTIVLNLDRGLGAHVGRADVIELPFYDVNFCKTILPNYTPESLKDTILAWLYKYGMQLKPHQTLVYDGNTTTQNAYHFWFEKNKHSFVTRNGQLNEFAEWSEKKSFYAELLELLKALPCHLIYICHEAEKKEKSGVYAGKVRPLLTGQVGDELLTHFTDWFRQLSADKPADFSSIDDTKLKLWGLTKKEFKDFCDSFPRNTIYYWQTEGDEIFDGKCSSLVNFPRFIPANYESFNKYKRK